MWSRPPSAVGAVWACAVLFTVALTADRTRAAIVPVGVTVDQYPLPAADDTSLSDPSAAPDLPSDVTAAGAPAAAIVPLPPPLLTGLTGLAALAAVRAGRHVYRRR
jgi:hypothetical protein